MVMDTIAIGFENLARAICGCVIDYKELNLSVGLVEAAINCSAYRLNRVVDGEDDADE